MLTLALALVAAPAAAQPPIEDGAFVATDGPRFVVDGEPFHVVGANAAVMHGRAHREAMPRTLAAAAADGLGVVRVWALGEYPADAPNWVRRYAFRIGPDGWVEESFAHLDAVLAEARRLNLRVVVVLANRWGDYGGTAQYLRWAGHPVTQRSPPPLALGPFWTSPRIEALYRAHVRRVVTRTNAITGVPYAEDPTIFAWELMNEAEAAGAAGEREMLAWLERQAAFVQALDDNHLVSAGHIGYWRRSERRLWRRVCALEPVDYCDSHAYPLRPGRVRSAAALARWIDDRVQLAQHVVGKPLLFGEVGVRTDRLRVHGRPRTRWLDRFLRRTLANGAAGALIWTYLPSHGARRTYGVYATGARVRQTRDVRRTLARHARLARRRRPRSINPRLGPERGDAPLFDATVRLAGARRPRDGWVGDTLRIDPRRFARARFETAGTWDGDPGPPHFYGGGAGEVRYRFRDPGHRPGALTVRLRASSELPGAGPGAGPEDVSPLTVRLDGVPLGTVTAPPDDGLGAWLELRVDDPAILARIPRRPVHRLSIAASGEGAGGVCLYDADETGAPAGVVIRWAPAPRAGPRPLTPAARAGRARRPPGPRRRGRPRPPTRPRSTAAGRSR